MATHADTLISLLDELKRFDERLGQLLQANRRHIAATEAHIADSLEQIAGRRRPRRRTNGSFLPPPR